MKKTICSLMMLVLLLTSIFTTAYAESRMTEQLGSWEVKTNSEGNKFIKNTQTNETIIAAFKFDSFGNRIDIDLVEHAQTLNHSTFFSVLEQEQPDISVSPRSINFPYFHYTYTESNSYIGIGEPSKVTADIRGPATVSTGSTVTKSQSFGGSITINGSISNAIKAGSSFSYTNSATSSSSFGASFPIPAERIGYVQFKPYYDVSVGTLR